MTVSLMVVGVREEGVAVYRVADGGSEGVAAAGSPADGSQGGGTGSPMVFGVRTIEACRRRSPPIHRVK